MVVHVKSAPVYPEGQRQRCAIIIRNQPIESGICPGSVEVLRSQGYVDAISADPNHQAVHDLVIADRE
jgi:hypothetical protein